MALKTNYKDDVLDISVNQNRTFVIKDENGNVLHRNVTLEETTEFSTEGDNFGAQDINATNRKVNEIENNKVGKWQGTDTNGNIYVPVEGLCFDEVKKHLGLMIGGADSPFPFSSKANGTLTIVGRLGCGVGYDGRSWNYSTVTITITIEEGVVTKNTISGNSVSSSAWSTSTNNHYGDASFNISSVEWVPAD